jgi:hypothetical protein
MSQKRIKSRKVSKLIAIHEAAHAVTAYLFGPSGNLGDMTINPYSGRVKQNTGRDSGLCGRHRAALIHWFGPMAEAGFYEHGQIQKVVNANGLSGEGDVNFVVDLMNFPMDAQQSSYFKKLLELTDPILSQLEPYILKLSNSLIKNGPREYTSSEANILVQQALEGSGLVAGSMCNCCKSD